MSEIKKEKKKSNDRNIRSKGGRVEIIYIMYRRSRCTVCDIAVAR